MTQLPRNDAFWLGRRVALTGATGFVGHHLALSLLNRGADVIALVRNLRKAERLSNAGARCTVVPLLDLHAMTAAFVGCDIVFHLAGAVDFENDWERFLEVNVSGTRTVLEAARAAGVRRVVHTSSIVAVGASWRPEILDEESAWNLARLRVPYISTKRWAEDVALSSRGQPEVVVVNPSSVIGPDDFTGSEFGTMCKRFWRGRIPVYFGGGMNVVDVRDVAAGHLLAAERGRSGERYLLTGTNRTFGAFFGDLARIAKRPIARLRLPKVLGVLAAEVLSRRTARNERRSYLTPSQARMLDLYFWFDNAKSRRVLGFQPRSYRETLSDTHAFWMGGKAG